MNNFFSYLRLLLLATSGMLLLCIIFAMNPELADGTLSGKICWFHFTSLLLAGGVLLMEFTTKKSRFIFSLTGCLIITSVRYRIGFLRQRRESSAGTFPFHRSAGCSLVYAQRCFTGASGITYRFSLRSSYLPESFRPSGGSAYHQSCSHHPSCLQAAWNIAETRAFLWLYRSHFSSLSEHITPF